MTNEREPLPGGGVRSSRNDEAPADARPASVARMAQTGRGRGLAWFAVLLALLALGGSGYFYYERLLLELPNAQATLRSLQERVAALERSAAFTAEDRSATEAVRLTTELRRDFDARLNALGAELEARARSGSVTPVPPRAPEVRTPRDWQLAEVRYLLRMANHRVLFERDVDGAVGLLRAADRILQQLDDLALHSVRARIAEEVLALESLPTLDAQGLFLQLEAIKRDVGRLPLRLPSLEPAGTTRAPAANLWDALSAEFARLVRFRRFDGAVRPLLAPDEAVYLELNLRLMLERTQLAALRREQTIYDESLVTALGWIAAYLDETAPEVRRVQEGLKSLQGVQLAVALPDISGSLTALDAELRPES